MASAKVGRVRCCAIVTAVGSVLAMVGCTMPPPPEEPGPYACGAVGPVVLAGADGESVEVQDISADGRFVLLEVFGAGGGPAYRYDLIDRQLGRRDVVVVPSPTGDGVQLWLADDGSRVIGLRHPQLGPGEARWFDYRTDSRTLSNLDPQLPAGVSPYFSSSLTHALVRAVDGWRRIDLATGASTLVGLTDDPAWRTYAVSGDLASVAQYSGGLSTTKSVRVVDVASGAVRRSIGQVRNENSSYVPLSFVDPDTLLVNDSVPLGSPPDGVANDGAFLVDLPSGTITRIDPEVAGASTRTATADGRRSLFAVILAQEMWLRRDGVNTQLVDSFDSIANDEISVAVTSVGGVATLHCV